MAAGNGHGGMMVMHVTGQHNGRTGGRAARWKGPPKSFSKILLFPARADLYGLVTREMEEEMRGDDASTTSHLLAPALLLFLCLLLEPGGLGRKLGVHFVLAREASREEPGRCAAATPMRQHGHSLRHLVGVCAVFCAVCM